MEHRVEEPMEIDEDWNPQWNINHFPEDIEMIDDKPSSQFLPIPVRVKPQTIVAVLPNIISEDIEMVSEIKEEQELPIYEYPEDIEMVSSENKEEKIISALPQPILPTPLIKNNNLESFRKLTTIKLQRKTVKRSWLDERLMKELRVKNYLNEIDLDIFRFCLTGNDPQLKNILGYPSIIGQGGFGTVYKTNLSQIPVVIKEALLTTEETKIMKKNVNNKILVNSYPQEYRMLILTSELVRLRQCPNFNLSYDIAVCSTCKLPSRKQIGSCYMTFLELASGDLSQLKGRFSEDMAESMLYQILLGMSSLHTIYGMAHSDYKLQNTLFEFIPSGGYFEYNIGNDVFYVKNTGIVLYISDFGLSRIFNPKYSSGPFYGTRNVHVLNDNKMEPITCHFNTEFTKNGLQLIPSTRFRWSDGSIGTINKFGPLDLLSSVRIDLKDCKRFPPTEFLVDIQDILQMFVGGKTPTHYFTHPGLKQLPLNFVTKVLKNVLDLTNQPIERMICYSKIGSVKYFSAIRMLKELYVPPIKIENIIDKFYA
jgi:serine/threonine protein kinase